MRRYKGGEGEGKGASEIKRNEMLQTSIRP
jgi:hypothetical protein